METSNSKSIMVFQYFANLFVKTQAAPRSEKFEFRKKSSNVPRFEIKFEALSRDTCE